MAKSKTPAAAPRPVELHPPVGAFPVGEALASLALAVHYGTTFGAPEDVTPAHFTEADTLATVHGILARLVLNPAASPALLSQCRTARTTLFTTADKLRDLAEALATVAGDLSALVGPEPLK